ncbi:MAG: FliA/WhiG family RNA polymerase sigma factor [Acidobacteria bacterium]|nr:FliA/WhiG family RNA polymerase sigma factor [Acidobacteriota bacterium]
MKMAAEDPAGGNDTRFEKRDRLVVENLPLVRAIALRISDHLPAHVELDDLIHEGLLGLTDAATRFDSAKHVPFSVYARHRIRGAILDSLRESDWATRGLRRRQRQMEAATHELQANLQRAPSEEEIAAKMGIETSRLRRIALEFRQADFISASSRAPADADLPAPEFPAHPESRPDSMCARTQIREKLEAAMSTLRERHRQVISLYYNQEMSMKEIGDAMGVNESRVSQIHKAALTAMAAALKSNGITSGWACYP